MIDYKRPTNNYAFRIVFFYAAVSILYIYLSDSLLKMAVSDIVLLSKVQTFKGLGFVIVTSVLLFYLVRKHLRSLSLHHQSILERERVYRAMLENNNDAIISLDTNGQITFCSNNLMEVTGYSAAQISRSNFFSHVHPEDITELRQCIEEIGGKSRKLFTASFRLILPDGKINWIECSMVNHLEDLVIQGVIINARNINQRKTDENELRESEEKYAKLFNSSPLPVWIYDVTTLAFIDINEAAVIQYGYSRKEFLSMTLPDIRPIEDVALLLNAVDNAKHQHHKGDQTLYRHLKKNGEQIFVRIESIAINLEYKNCRMVLVIDMTGYLLQQNALIESSEKLKIAQEIAGLGYWKHDVNSGRIFWSDEMYHLFDKEPATFTPTFSTIIDSVPLADRYLFTPDFELSRQSAGAYEMEHRVITSDLQEKWLLCRMKLTIVNGQVTIRDGVAADITRRKRDEAAIIRKSILLNSLNKFTSSLLLNENWITVIDKLAHTVASPLKIDTIMYFEHETDSATGETFICLKQQWGVNGTGQTPEYAKLTPRTIRESPDVINMLSQVQSYEAGLASVPEGQFKRSLELAGVKSIYIRPLFVDGRFHGFFSFIDCKTERIWDEDEQLFAGSLVSNIAIKIEKHIAETEVRETKGQFVSVISNLPGIAIRRRASGLWPLIFVNNEIERLTGYKASDFVENAVRSFESIIHPDDREKKIGRIQNLRADESFTLEFRLICSDERIIWIRGNGRAVAGADGKVAYVDEVLIDITETYKKELELIAGNERFRAVMRAAAEAIIDWDIVNDTVVWGDGFTEFFGYTPGADDNTLWSRNIHPDDKEWVTRLMDNTVNDPAKENFYAEFRYLKANGTQAYVQNRCTFIRDSNGKAIRAIGAMADVTESAEKRREIETQNQLLRDIAWMQSHVIRAPLARLLGLLSLFKERDKSDIPEEDLLEYIVQSANSLDQVIHDIVKKARAVTTE